MRTLLASEGLPHTTDAPGCRQLVLLVEDEVLIRIELAHLLQERGLRVLEAADAEEAVQVLEAGTEHIDLVLSDVCMPREADGLRFVQWLKDNRPSLPVVLCTALTSLVPFGGPVIRKPYDPEKLVQQVEASLELAAGVKRSSPSDAGERAYDPFGMGVPTTATTSERARMYREKASEIFGVAEGALDLEARASLLGIAESYLQMAITLETVERFRH